MCNRKDRHQRRNRQPLIATVTSLFLATCAAFSNRPTYTSLPFQRCTLLSMADDDWRDSSNDSNLWASDDGFEVKEDWQELMARKNDGSFWSDFEPSADDDEETKAVIDKEEEEIDDADIWLDTLASISADEVEFNMAEAERADK